MAAYRYWRVLFEYRDGNRTVDIQEVEMRATVGGANTATGGTASSSGAQGSFPASAAFDGSSATSWRSTQEADTVLRWLQYDFGASTAIAQVGLRFGASLSSTPLWSLVLGSDDGVFWSVLPPRIYWDSSHLSALNLFTLGVLGPTTLVGGVQNISPGWPTGDLGGRVTGAPVQYDAADGGTYRVAGTVAIDGTPTTPAKRRVRLLHRLSGRLVRETWSAPTGEFSFEKIALAEYVVLADDHTRVYNAVVADAVQSVP